jgi:hypothetical protein
MFAACRSDSLTFEQLEPRLTLAANFVISEFLADNGTSLDNYGATTDWIEIHNTGDAAGNLLNYGLTDDDSIPLKWQFPSVNVPAGGYLLVYASGMDDRDPLQPLHANFSLSKEGEYLGLSSPTGAVLSEFAPQFPVQRSDISQGLGQVVDILSYVAPAAAAQSLVPTAATDPHAWKQVGFVPDATWIGGATGVGFGQTFNGFRVRTFQANTAANSPVGTTLDTIDEVLELIGNPAAYTSVTAGNYAAVNFRNNYSGAGNATRYTTGQIEFPGEISGTDYNHIATEVHAQITIPAAGAWTFGLDHNEGYLLQIGDNSATQNGTGSTERFHTFTFDAPGVYDLDLYHFERTGSSWLKLYAAQGTHTSFSAAAFDLVGDTANGGLAVQSNLVGSTGSSIAQLLGTNMQSQMLGVNSSVYTRNPFNVANPADLEQLQLRMKYDDGFVAYLNGTEIARRNFAATPQWNSHADSPRTGDEVLNFVDIDVSAFLPLLVPGQNVLAIHGMNFSVSDPDALILPELNAIDVQSTGIAFFTTPTPGSANGTGIAGFVAEPTFSVERGFFNAPFQLTISGATPQSQIYYTTNGDLPTQSAGTLYTGPIAILGTKVVRAVAFRSGYLESASVSQTYIFLNDVVRQSAVTAQAAGLPATWGSLTTDYGMDPDVIGNWNSSGVSTGGDLYAGAYAATIKSDLLSIPTLSIVMDADDMFGPSGIYTNSGQGGSAWERPVSIEWITNDNSLEFQVNAGIRIQGGAFRGDNFTKKHSLRLLFKNEYGPGKLTYPIFGDDSDVASEFNTIVLRAGANDGYSWNSARYTEQYIRDQFGRELQQEMGHAASHGTFAHLYINGVYWGLYNPVERPDNEFAASYVSGDPDNWDSIHVTDTPSGDGAAWDAMLALAATAGSSNADYFALQGRNPNGTPNPSVAPLLDMTNYIDYILLNAWGGNWDWPNKNYWAGRDRDPATTEGFQFFSWDFENTMGNNRSRSPLNATTFDDITKFTGARSVGQPHTSLKTNAEYRLAFADRVQKYSFNSGLLTPTNLAARYSAIANSVQQAIVAESARWGDQHHATPLTLADWVTERNWILNTHLPQRSSLVMSELVSYGLYPGTAAPTFSQQGGLVNSGYDLAVAAPQGVIYYTLDGSDPRLVGGAISPTAIAYSGPIDIAVAITVSARALNGTEWSALNEAAFTVTPPANETNLKIVELHYNPSALAGVSEAADLEFIELLNPSNAPVSLNGVHITDFSSTPYVFPSGIILGAGQRYVVARTPSTLQGAYGGTINMAAAGYAPQNLSNGGETITLVGPQGALQSITYGDSAGWPTSPDGGGKSLEIIDPFGAPSDPRNWRASYYQGGSPGTDGAPPIVAGDANNDGDVNGSDFLAWQRGLGTTPLRGVAANGDFDGDRDVDSMDLAALRSNWGAPTSGVAIAGSAAFMTAEWTAVLADAPRAIVAASQAAAVLRENQWIFVDSTSARPSTLRPERTRAADGAFTVLHFPKAAIYLGRAPVQTNRDNAMTKATPELLDLALSCDEESLDQNSLLASPAAADADEQITH